MPVFHERRVLLHSRGVACALPSGPGAGGGGGGAGVGASGLGSKGADTTWIALLVLGGALVAVKVLDKSKLGRPVS